MHRAKFLLLATLVVVVYILHQDFWNWRRYEPLVFGFLPVGLAYHAGYSVLASITMGILVKFAWPAHLENTEPDPSARKPDADSSSSHS